MRVSRRPAEVYSGRGGDDQGVAELKGDRNLPPPLGEGRGRNRGQINGGKSISATSALVREAPELTGGCLTEAARGFKTVAVAVAAAAAILSLLCPPPQRALQE